MWMGCRYKFFWYKYPALVLWQQMFFLPNAMNFIVLPFKTTGAGFVFI